MNKIQDTTEAMLTQQAFYSTLDTNFANYVTTVVDRLQQHDDAQVLPSDGWIDYNVVIRRFDDHGQVGVAGLATRYQREGERSIAM